MDFQREEVLQAVVLADSFTTTMRPITYEMPKVLLPLVNIPMIEYTLEFLVSSGVKQIFVVCCAHAKQVEDYIAASPRIRKDDRLLVKVIRSENSFSVGDALRHVAELGVIEDQFVLISGDIVSNIKLDSILANHRSRFKADKQNIMTIVMKTASQNHPTRSLDDDTVVGVNKETGQLLLYDDDVDQNNVSIDVTLFEDNPELQIRYDLMDSHIDICSPEVLMLFQDNFDWQHLRSDFTHGILGSEILGNKIFVHTISGAYAARVKDLRTYNSISQNIIHRWTFPMVPDVNLFCDTTFKFLRHNVYKEELVSLERSCTLKEDVVIGSGTKLGAHTNVSASTIGRGCSIGKNVQITGSYIWGDVTIEDDVKIDRAIICNGAVIKQGSTVERGSVISFNVVIGPNFIVQAHSQITTRGEDGENYHDDDGNENKSTVHEWNPEEVGVGGVGRLCTEHDLRLLAEKHFYNSIAPNPEALQLSVHPDRDNTDESDFDEDEGDYELEEEKFNSEIRATLERGIQGNMEVDNIIVEIASLKLAHDMTVVQYSAGAFYGLLCQVTPDPKEFAGPDKFKPTKVVRQRLVKMLGQWKLVWTKFGKMKREQVFILTGLGDICLQYQVVFLPLFQLLLQQLYELEICTEDAIFEWQAMANDTPAYAQLLDNASVFLTWLKEAESDDESDESDE